MHYLKMAGCFLLVFGGFFAVVQLFGRLLGVHNHPSVSRLHLIKAQIKESEKEN